MYISHEDYKTMMAKFQANSPKGVLKENVEEGNAFTAALAKAKKGEKVKVDGEEITDTSNYDDPKVKEGYADRYPGSEKLDNIFKEEDEFEEGLNPAPLQATGPTISTVEEDHMDKPFKLPKRTDTSKLDYDPDASRFEPDYMKTPGEDDDEEEDDFISTSDNDDMELPKDVSKMFKKMVDKDKTRYPFLRENTNPPFGFSVLSPDERKQLKEYIESVKTIKKEIAKLAAKAGKKVKTEGGDTTGLVMPTNEKRGDDDAEAEAMIAKIEKEKEGEEAVKGQWDLEEKSYSKYKKGVMPGMKFKTVPNPNAGKYRVMSIDDKHILDWRFFDTEEEAAQAIKARQAKGELNQSLKVIKLPDTMVVYAP